MTTFLQRIAPDLAITALTAPLVSYGLHRMFPSPNLGFLAVASTVTICAINTIKTMNDDRTKQLSSQNLKKQPIYQRINNLLTISSCILLPIFARYVAQRVGIQVPGYLKTVAYFALVSSACAMAKNTYEYLKL